MADNISIEFLEKMRLAAAGAEWFTPDVRDIVPEISVAASVEAGVVTIRSVTPEITVETAVQATATDIQGEPEVAQPYVLTGGASGYRTATEDKHTRRVRVKHTLRHRNGKFRKKKDKPRRFGFLPMRSNDGKFLSAIKQRS